MDFFSCFPRAAHKRAHRRAKKPPRAILRGAGKTPVPKKQKDPTPRAKSACARISPFEASLSRTGRDCRLAARKFRAGYSFKAENHSVVAPIIKNARPFVNCSARLFFGCAARGGCARSAPLSPDPSESRARAAPARSRRASLRCPPKRCDSGSRPSRF